MEERRLPGDNQRRIMQVLPSAHWPQNAVVLVTDCGHRHVRPRGFVVGSVIHCPFCDDKPRLPAMARLVDAHSGIVAQNGRTSDMRAKAKLENK